MENSKLKAQSLKLVCVISLLFSVFLFGCEKVIDVDLNDASPAIVIEGNLAGSPEFAEVRISKTSSYFDDLTGEKISGATVVIESKGGERYVLSDAGNGIYRTRLIPLQDNTTYNLSVETNGLVYTASSKLNPAVYIDSVSYYYEEKYSFFEDGYVVQVYFTDPAGVENYYRIRILINGELQNDIDNLFIFNDRFVDGQQLEISLRDKDFSQEDSVTVQLISLDENIYEFYNTFRELLFSNPGSAAPANPTTNLSNGALGYFSAYSFDLKTLMIKE